MIDDISDVWNMILENGVDPQLVNCGLMPFFWFDSINCSADHEDKKKRVMQINENIDMQKLKSV